MKGMIINLVRALMKPMGCEVIELNRRQREIMKQRPAISYDECLIAELSTRSTGSVSVAEARFLGELIRGLTSKGPIVEIGTLFGGSTLAMVAHKPVEMPLITVDNYAWNPLRLSSSVHLEVAMRNLSEAIQKFNVRLVNMDKDEFFRTYTGPAPSLVFLDAIHEYEPTKVDIEWARGVKAEVVCGHDYNPQLWPQVCKVVDEFGGPRKLVETLWVLPP